MTMNRTRTEYVIRKIAEMVAVLFVLSILVFVIARMCPGDPLRSWYGDGVDRMNEAQKAAARHSLGLDQPLILQYFHWLGNLFQGNLGISFKYKQPVSRVIGNVWFNTLILGLASYILTFAAAFKLGRVCASNEGKLTDRIICHAGVISGNIPSFVLALVFILVFAVQLRILPTGGAYSYGQSSNLFDRIWHLVLPVTVLVLGHLWYYAYMVRNLLVEETRRDYVLLLKSEGIPRDIIIRKYCMKNILPPMLTIMAIAVPHLLGGTYVVEMVFGYPGLGTLSFESALYKDYNMLMAVSLLTGAVVVIGNFLAQMISERIDPRMQHGQGMHRRSHASEPARPKWYMLAGRKLGAHPGRVIPNQNIKQDVLEEGGAEWQE